MRTCRADPTASVCIQTDLSELHVTLCRHHARTCARRRGLLLIEIADGARAGLDELVDLCFLRFERDEILLLDAQLLLRLHEREEVGRDGEDGRLPSAGEIRRAGRLVELRFERSADTLRPPSNSVTADESPVFNVDVVDVTTVPSD